MVMPTILAYNDDGDADNDVDGDADNDVDGDADDDDYIYKHKSVQYSDMFTWICT